MRLTRLFTRKCEKERAALVAEARRAAFSDAVFLIHHYNTRARRWAPDPKPPEITPEEVFGPFDREGWAGALTKARKLSDAAAYVGMAYFGYEHVKHTYAQARKLLREENPGFSERSYELATGAAITDMR
jgi:hypothetical protein